MEYQVEVRVSLKKGVLDAEGETVQKSLSLLGFRISRVETVKTYVITVDAGSEDAAVKTVEDACQRLLANPVIQEYSITVV
ncbi:MAG: phosphoribosylformylglycinamidine synthase subunit PurS [Candidatus Altiarchaeota archaeon]